MSLGIRYAVLTMPIYGVCTLPFLCLHVQYILTCHTCYPYVESQLPHQYQYTTTTIHDISINILQPQYMISVSIYYNHNT